MTHKAVVTRVNCDTNEVTLHFEDFSVIKKFEQLTELPIGITTRRWKEERSIAQNNFLWACIGDIARVTQNPDKWQIYIEMLKRYGKFTHVLVHPKAVERFKKEWREVEELGEITTENGDKAIQLRLYYGSHLLDTGEMANLITGTLDEMKALGIKPKLSKEEMERYGLNQ